jgi:CRP/FNR family transcriptional regulator, cyclic AMP receptor protein
MLGGDEAKTLRWVDGFRDLSPEDIRRISRACSWKWYKPEQCIFSQGDEARDVFFIVQGAVRITSYSMMGKQVSFRDLARSAILPPSMAAPGRQRPWRSPMPCWRRCRRARTGRR